jgi:transposase
MRWSRGSFSASVGSTWSCGRCSGRSRRIAKLAARPRWRRFAFETAPGHQLQIDFGERRVLIGGREIRVCFFVAVLGYSRRIYVRAFLRERHDDWREGLSGACLHFGGVTQTVLVDNARELILGRDIETGVVHVHPAFSEFCADWGVAPRACRPYRARTKGKTESGVGYVKRNAIAGRSFGSFVALEAHLTGASTSEIPFEESPAAPASQVTAGTLN